MEKFTDCNPEGKILNQSNGKCIDLAADMPKADPGHEKPAHLVNPQEKGLSSVQIQTHGTAKYKNEVASHNTFNS